MRRGAPPRRSKASVWPSRNASWPSPGKHTWTARPECESRITNIDSSVSTPSSQTLTPPKSTSASSPGGCNWGIVTTELTGLQLAAHAADVGAHRRLGDRSRRTHRRGAPRPAAPCGAACAARSGRPRATPGSISTIRTELRRRLRDACLRGGGSADLSACRTVRRCTRWRCARPRMETPSSRRSRRICSNSCAS